MNLHAHELRRILIRRERSTSGSLLLAELLLDRSDAVLDLPDLVLAQNLLLLVVLKLLLQVLELLLRLLGRLVRVRSVELVAELVEDVRLLLVPGLLLAVALCPM